MTKIKAAILGPGNIGMDLMFKIFKRSKNIELALVSGIIPDSPGLALAQEKGVKTAVDGVASILADDSIKLVFDCTSARAHQASAPLLKAKGKTVIDLTPAAVGPFTIPAVNLEKNLGEDNLNMVTCGGQATVPMVWAVNQITRVKYAEIISTISSKSAGPGTRANIDEFTYTTTRAVVELGGAEKGKTIILMNPADPPILMRNTIYCQVEDPEKLPEIQKGVKEMAARLAQDVPGYRLRLEPILDGDRVTMMIEVEGEGDYLPTYSGNLDIITATALTTAERLAQKLMQ